MLLCNLSCLFLRTFVFLARGLSSFLRRKDTNQPPVTGWVSWKLTLRQRLACRGLPGTLPVEGGEGVVGRGEPQPPRGPAGLGDPRYPQMPGRSVNLNLC